MGANSGIGMAAAAARRGERLCDCEAYRAGPVVREAGVRLGGHGGGVVRVS